MPAASTLATTLLAVALIVGLAAICGALAKRLGQPAVIGEILAGIALGPTLLGPLELPGGTLSEMVFTAPVRSQLTALATLGLLVFMFTVGLELDLRRIRAQRRQAVLISAASVAVPMLLGAGLAVLLYTRHGNGSPVTAFILFIGVAMSITAFPVLARILAESGLASTPVGTLALACAAVDDVLAWSLLAVASALAGTSGAGGVATVIGAIAFLGVTIVVVRRLAALIVRRYQRAGRLTPGVFVAVLSGMLISAYATERIGIHAIFGAFAFGAAFPRDDMEGFIADLLMRLEDISMHVLLPVFFVVTGLSVDVRALDGGSLLLIPVVILVACTGKFGASFLTARGLGIPRRQAGALGVLMNTRGLTELVALNVGFTIGVLDRSLLTVFVIMAVVTTVMTAPLLRLIGPVGPSAAGPSGVTSSTEPADAVTPDADTDSCHRGALAPATADSAAQVLADSARSGGQ